MTEVQGLLAPDDLEAALRRIGAERYHNLHRFHRRLHGACSKDQVRAWALNRYLYQSMIPIKDATILSRMHDPASRRAWRERLVDHDGSGGTPGGIEKWLHLTDSLGFSQAYVVSTQGALPATRFAVEAYVNFCAQRSLLEAVASSLSERGAGMLAHYPFVSAQTLVYFTARPLQAKRDSDFALDYVKRHATTAATQAAVLAALEFKCAVLWSQLDALHSAYVEGAIPPGAWRADAGVAGEGGDL